jgi:hypothetical protein
VHGKRSHENTDLMIDKINEQTDTKEGGDKKANERFSVTQLCD